MGDISISKATLSRVTDALEGLQNNKVSIKDVEKIIDERMADAVRDFARETGERRIKFAGAPITNPNAPPHTIFDESDRSYKAMFCRKGEALSSGGFTSFDEFYTAVSQRLNDERVTKSLNEGDGSDGGFAVPAEYAAQVFDVALEQELVRPRATVYPMASNQKKISGTVIGDHSSNLSGVVGYWKKEESDLTAAEPKFRSIDLKASKLTIYGKSSSEWYEDATEAPQTVQRAFSGGLSWYLDFAFLRGSGAGEPLGILNSSCLVTVSKEETQPADTVLLKNLAHMLAALHPACWARSVWCMHPTVIPQLLQLGTQTGDTGSGIVLPVDRQTVSVTPSGINLLTRPCLITEKCNPVGDKGDIMLADFSQYAIGLRKDVRLESTPYVYFESDELAHRGIIRADGQPLWDEALTLQDGSTTVSPFVVIEARA